MNASYQTGNHVYFVAVGSSNKYISTFNTCLLERCKTASTSMNGLYVEVIYDTLDFAFIFINDDHVHLFLGQS